MLRPIKPLAPYPWSCAAEVPSRAASLPRAMSPRSRAAPSLILLASLLLLVATKDQLAARAVRSTPILDSIAITTTAASIPPAERECCGIAADAPSRHPASSFEQNRMSKSGAVTSGEIAGKLSALEVAWVPRWRGTNANAFH